MSKNKFYEHQDGYMVGITQKGQEFYFDKEDFNIISQYTWGIRKDNYVVTNYRGKEIYFHHLILPIVAGLERDHINNKRNDNRRMNLRASTHKQNGSNLSKQKGTRSSFKGVSWHKKYNRWQSKIRVNYKWIYIGQFVNEIDAAIAYNKAAINYFGEYAKLNE